MELKLGAVKADSDFLSLQLVSLWRFSAWRYHHTFFRQSYTGRL